MIIFILSNFAEFSPERHRDASLSLGAGPGTARTGDKVFLPQGCSVPLVIRPSESKFEVVADAFVCGVMQGEMFWGKDDGLLNLQDIVLR
jgi:hypothetical protein